MLGGSQRRRSARATTPGHSVWVEASAGTGKTKVLTDRVTRLLLDGIEPERILCLTFTKAAAAEMGNRLADAARPLGAAPSEPSSTRRSSS